MLIGVDLNVPEQLAHYAESGQVWTQPLLEHPPLPGREFDMAQDPRLSRCAVEPLLIADKLETWLANYVRMGQRGAITQEEIAEVEHAEGYGYAWGMIAERVSRTDRFCWDLYVPGALCSEQTLIFHPREVESMALFYFESLFDEIEEAEGEPPPITVSAGGSFSLVTLEQIGATDAARRFMADDVCAFAMPRLLRFLDLESKELAQQILQAQRIASGQARLQ